MIPWHKPTFWGKEKQYVNMALDSTWISDGSFLSQFEENFSTALGVKHTVTTSNGTTALHLAYLTLGVMPGDEIIVPSFSFHAPANIALSIGAKPVFADVDPSTWCLDTESIIKKITPRTKAIVAVHTYGNACDMLSIISSVKGKNISIIEDVAEALFTKYDEQYLGTMGDIGCFSFQATKTITTGEGGCIVTNNAEHEKKARLFRNHGMHKKRYYHEVVGHNFRLTNLQAAIGCAQLEEKEKIIQNKCRVYEQYVNQLKDKKGLLLQGLTARTKPVMWAIALLVRPNYFKLSRDELIAAMKSFGIETRPGFYPPSSMDIYRNVHSFSTANKLSDNVISLPSYASLSEEKIVFICEKLFGLLSL